MSTAQSSPETSPVESELEKGEFEKANGRAGGEEEEEAEEAEEERDGISVAETGQPDPYLRPPLKQTQSRSSARSHTSYTDGYTHFGQEEDEERSNKEAAATAGVGVSSGKEFEVGFDGDSDPLSPKNKSTLRKWLIVIIVSASSLCVTCASALYTSTYRQLEAEFGASRELATVGLTVNCPLT